MTRVIAVCALLLGLFSVPVLADVPEDDYATEFFGTVVRFETAQPVAVESEYGYWGEGLDDRLYDHSYLAGQANAVRQRKGLPLLGDDTYLYIGTEEPYSETGGVYVIKFQWLTPEEVREILAGVGNLSSLLPGAQISFSPLKQRYFDAFVYNLDDPLVIDEYGVRLSFSPGTGVKAMLPQLNAAFKQRFGEQTVVDSMYYSENLYGDGDEGSRSCGFQVMIEVPEGYYGYGG